MSDDAVLRTGRLLVRRFRSADADALRHVICDPDVMHDRGPLRPERVRDWIGWQIAAYPHRPGLGRWAVLREDALIGYGALFREPGHCGPDEAELGYRLARAQWGRGYATELARGLVSYGLGAQHLGRIVALIDPGNTASRRVAEKAGLARVGEIMLPGYSHPDLVYEIRAGSA